MGPNNKPQMLKVGPKFFGPWLLSVKRAFTWSQLWVFIAGNTKLLFFPLSGHGLIHLCLKKKDDAQTHLGPMLCKFWACNEHSLWTKNLHKRTQRHIKAEPRCVWSHLLQLLNLKKYLKIGPSQLCLWEQCHKSIAHVMTLHGNFHRCWVRSKCDKEEGSFILQVPLLVTEVWCLTISKLECGKKRIHPTPTEISGIEHFLLYSWPYS